MNGFDDVPDTSIDNILLKERAKLITDLAAVLDVEAGLREAMIAARHANLVMDLREVLDIDAGLSAIVTAAPASVASAAATEASRRTKAHVRGNPFRGAAVPGASALIHSLRLLWKLVKPHRRRTPAQQAAAFIEMRLITRSLREYFADYRDRVDSLRADIVRARSQGEDLSEYVSATAGRLEVWRARSMVSTVEIVLAQCIIDASSLAVDLGQPQTSADKLTSVASKIGARKLARDGAALSAHVASCIQEATRVWKSLHSARAAAGDMEWHVVKPRLDELYGLTKDIDRGCEGAEDATASLSEKLAIANARNPVEYLASIEIDASGADLSQANLPDVDLLDGVIWTPETTWPTAIEGEVRAHSREIREKVYQIHGGRGIPSKGINV